MKMHQLVVGLFQVNCFLLQDPLGNDALLIDPGDDASIILDLIQRKRAQVLKIINTHAHLDHVLAVAEVQSITGASFHLHQAELATLEWTPAAVSTWLGRPFQEPKIDGFLDDEDVVHLGDYSLEIRHVPGHSPGSIIFIDHADKRAWVGDTVFAGGIGRVDFPGCSFPTLIEAIHTQILSLPDSYILYPGHGPSTTVGRERRTNPFLTDEIRSSAADMDV